MNITNYRAALYAALCTAKDANGLPRLSAQEAKILAEELTDEELEDGMDFNTPEEVAEWLLEDL